MVNYSKLKTNLRLCENRLKLLEKKKTELALKARKEIADYLSTGKVERARIRVEHIIREDYLVEAMEIVEMYCDLVLARFGLIEQMKTLDDGIAEAVSSLIWVAPRLHSDCPELNTIADGFAHKYGKPYAQAARENALKTVNSKLMRKMGIEAPPKVLVEQYLIEIAKSNNIEYEPDPLVLDQGRGSGGAGGGMGENQLIDLGADALTPFAPPPLPALPPNQQYYPASAGPAQPAGFNVPTDNSNTYLVKNPNYLPTGDTLPSDFVKEPPPRYDSIMNNLQAGGRPPPTTASAPASVPAPRPTPRTKMNTGFDNLPELPDVPDTIPQSNEKQDGPDDLNFEDLAKRFEALKKRK